MIFVTFGNDFCDLWEYDWGMVYYWVYHIRHIGIWLGEYATIRICWFVKWVWINTYRYIFSGMNIHLPAILMFTRGTRF